VNWGHHSPGNFSVLTLCPGNCVALLRRQHAKPELSKAIGREETHAPEQKLIDSENDTKRGLSLTTVY